VQRGQMKDVRVHMIADDGLMNALSAATKLSPSPQLLARLKAAGQAAAERFLSNAGKRIGQEPTVDLPDMLGQA
jgi:NTE family protein